MTRIPCASSVARRTLRDPARVLTASVPEALKALALRVPEALRAPEERMLREGFAGAEA